MNRDETVKILGTIRAAYPKFHKESKREDLEAAIKLWQMMFETDAYQDVQMAVTAFIATDTKGFPPHIGAIKELLANLRSNVDGELTEQEAWALVKKAMRNGIYGYQKEFAALPPEIQRCIGAPMQLHDWAIMDTETVDSVVSSNFMRSYRARASHVREQQKLPADVQVFFGLARQAFALPGEQGKSESLPAETAEPAMDLPANVPPPSWFDMVREKSAQAAARMQAQQGGRLNDHATASVGDE